MVERLGAVTAVTSHDDAARGIGADLSQPGDHALGRSTHGVAIHPGWPGHLGSAQSRGAEREGYVEATVELDFVTVVQQRLQRFAVVDVGVPDDPFEYPFAQRFVHRTGTTRVNNVPSDAAALSPASRTSRWFR